MKLNYICINDNLLLDFKSEVQSTQYMIICTLIVFTMIICTIIMSTMIICTMIYITMIICTMIVCMKIVCTMVICIKIICTMNFFQNDKAMRHTFESNMYQCINRQIIVSKALPLLDTLVNCVSKLPLMEKKGYNASKLPLVDT